MAKKPNNDDKPKSSKPLIIFAVIISLAIAIGSWVYLIKTNKFFGLGEILRPNLKDVPIICMILPEVKEPDADPNIMAREEINTKYSKLLNENTTLQKELAELRVQVSDKKELEDKYKILLKEVDSLSRELSDLKTEEVNEVVSDNEDKVKNLVKIYESMEASEAATILEEMGELNIGLVVDICKAMKSAKFAEVMQEMSTEFAAILSERMVV